MVLIGLSSGGDFVLSVVLLDKVEDDRIGFPVDDE